MLDKKSSITVLLTAASVRKLGGSGDACIIARDASVYVGTQRCTPVTNDVASHPYCGCAWRQGVAFPSTGGTVNLRARINY